MLAFILMLLGYIATWTSPFIWGAHGLYQLFKTDLGFWEILLSNGGCFLLQLVVGIILICVGYFINKK